jgi:hypothetical protein
MEHEIIKPGDIIVITRLDRLPVTLLAEVVSVTTGLFSAKLLRSGTYVRVHKMRPSSTLAGMNPPDEYHVIGRSEEDGKK